jgi:alpha-beta hydrolase superfamily lysophospholipase
MTANRVLDGGVTTERTIELVFAGDSVRLAGQIDYPNSPPPADGYPLIFILHHAGCDSRKWYEPFAQIGLANGYAVFRWDKRGTGHSGASGRGSATQDAVNAYEVALEQPYVNHKQAVILAQDAGTGLLGSAYGLFARLQKPHGVILVSNMLDEDAVAAIDAPVYILMSETDWNPWQQYARSAAVAHDEAYRLGSSFCVVPDADRKLIDDDTRSLPPAARSILADWLQDLCRRSA